MLHCNKKLLSKYVWFISVEKISFIRSCDVEEIKAMDCIIKVHITSGNIKLRSFALRFCASNLKAHDNLCFPLRRAYLLFLSYTLYKSHGDLHLSFLHFILWQAQCVGNIQIYIAYWMWVFMNYYCWHYPWGKRLGGKTISPYLSLCPIKTSYP